MLVENPADGVSGRAVNQAGTGESVIKVIRSNRDASRFKKF